MPSSSSTTRARRLPALAAYSQMPSSPATLATSLASFPVAATAACGCTRTLPVLFPQCIVVTLHQVHQHAPAVPSSRPHEFQAFRMLTRLHVPRGRQRFHVCNVSACTTAPAAFSRFDAVSRYNGIEGVSFTEFEQRLSDHIVDALVSFSKDSAPSWWPIYRCCSHVLL